MYSDCHAFVLMLSLITKTLFKTCVIVVLPLVAPSLALGGSKDLSRT